MKKEQNSIKMKPTLVADEMFPEGANFMELDEVQMRRNLNQIHFAKFFIFRYLNLQPGSGSGLLMDLAANEKDVHADFFNGESILQNYEFGCRGCSSHQGLFS